MQIYIRYMMPINRQLDSQSQTQHFLGDTGYMKQLFALFKHGLFAGEESWRF